MHKELTGFGGLTQLLDCQEEKIRATLQKNLILGTGSPNNQISVREKF